MDYDIYSYEDVYEQAMKHFNDNTEAVNLWLSKIALKDSNGNLCERTPDDSLRRVAHEIARVECRYSDPLQARDRRSPQDAPSMPKARQTD